MKFNINHIVPDVVRWNMDRGLLNKFDPELENRMLTEEAAEFYEAWHENWKAEMLQEAADYIFVLVGTRHKFARAGFSPTASVVGSHADGKAILDTGEIVLGSILELVEEVFTKNAGPLMEIALMAVTRANQAKPNKKDGGKIVKGDTYVSPLESIKEALASYGGYADE